MSQSRTRKSSSAANGEASRTDATTEARMRSVGKAAGDSDAGGKARAHHAPRPAHSRTKVPRAVRDELENALVGLCDVWFEDIKPHLVMNNIKLHGHGARCAGAAGAGGGGGGGTASGDHTQPRLCAHADPGAASDQKAPAAASSASFCQTRPPGSRAQCRRPPQPSPPRPCHTGTWSSKPPPQNQVQCESPPQQPAPRPPRREPQPPPHISWLAPHLCAYSVLDPLEVRPGTVDSLLSTPGPSTRSSKPLILDCVRFKHRCTQTVPASQIAGYNVSPSQQKCGRCPATTTLHPHRSRGRDKNRRKPPPLSSPNNPLMFEDDTDDKNIRVLFKSPSREETLSVMNLIVSPKPKSPSHKDKRLPPWK